MKKNKNFLILWDFDGTLIDNMKEHIKLASELMVKYFKVKKKWAERKYIETSGIPFDKQLEIIFPEKELEIKRIKCAKEYHQRKIKEVYQKALPIKGAITILKKLQKLKYRQFILSGTEERIVRRWLSKNKILRIGVLGKEKGIKKYHLEILRKKFSKGKFILISDSFKDLILPVEIRVGFYKNKKEKEILSKAKPNFLINDLKKVEKILQVERK